jgi:hypothetical protein
MPGNRPRIHIVTAGGVGSDNEIDGLAGIEVGRLCGRHAKTGGRQTQHADRKGGNDGFSHCFPPQDSCRSIAKPRET